MTLTWLSITALTAVMTVFVSLSAVSDGVVAVILAGLYLALCGGAVYIITRHIRTIDRCGVGGGKSAPFGKRWDRLATVAVLLVGISVVFSFPVGFGAALPYLVRSFGRYAPGERFERRRLGLGD
ncbi:hypothetical protein ACQEVS_11075 [Streptomyces sp. CA-181903]|uniref:hypothetical protein n=1 Tax=Streptomyces sp. CA-181903 TaxID=3240055 RepID=UPI003D8E47C2